MKKKLIASIEKAKKKHLKDSQIKTKMQELAKLWGSNIWEGDLEQMRKTID
ncbi:MAG: hypothetical protein V4683_02960 [Bacteroidota bacterium]